MCNNADDIVQVILTDTGFIADAPSGVSGQVSVTRDARCLTPLWLILSLGAFLASNIGIGWSEGAGFAVRCTQIVTDNSDTAASVASPQAVHFRAAYSLVSDWPAFISFNLLSISSAHIYFSVSTVKNEEHKGKRKLL